MTSEDFFIQLDQHFEDVLPFVAYRKPDDLEVKVLLQNNDEVFLTKDFSESGFVFAPFNTEENTVLIPLDNSNVITTTNYVMSSAVETSHKDDLINEVEKYQHINLVQKGINAIENSELKKVVLSRCETVSKDESNPIELFQKLLNQYRNAFVYCWYHPKVGLWLGATPETLLKVDANRFETMALAGTQAYNDTLETEWQSKEINEQQIVTDSIVKNLQSTVNMLTIGETKTVKAGNLLHLKTTISGTLNFKLLNLKQLLGNLHPTPAVCGLPKNVTKQFILENENYNREFYTGFLGELNFKESKTRNTNRRNIENNAYASVKTVSNLFVNLRCMQLKSSQALIYVGGGITKDSNPEDEWQETVNKTQTIKQILS